MRLIEGRLGRVICEDSHHRSWIQVCLLGSCLFLGNALCGWSLIEAAQTKEGGLPRGSGTALALGSSGPVSLRCLSPSAFHSLPTDLLPSEGSRLAAPSSRGGALLPRGRPPVVPSHTVNEGKLKEAVARVIQGKGPGYFESPRTDAEIDEALGSTFDPAGVACRIGTEIWRGSYRLELSSRECSVLARNAKPWLTWAASRGSREASFYRGNIFCFEIRFDPPRLFSVVGEFLRGTHLFQSYHALPTGERRHFITKCLEEFRLSHESSGVKLEAVSRQIGEKFLRGGPRDQRGCPEDARLWLEYAKDRGDPKAAFFLANMSYYGEGGAEDYSLAMKLFAEAGSEVRELGTFPLCQEALAKRSRPGGAPSAPPPADVGVKVAEASLEAYPGLAVYGPSSAAARVGEVEASLGAYPGLAACGPLATARVKEGGGSLAPPRPVNPEDAAFASVDNELSRYLGLPSEDDRRAFVRRTMASLSLSPEAAKVVASRIGERLSSGGFSEKALPWREYGEKGKLEMGSLASPSFKWSRSLSGSILDIEDLSQATGELFSSGGTWRGEPEQPKVVRYVKVLKKPHLIEIEKWLKLEGLDYFVVVNQGKEPSGYLVYPWYKSILKKGESDSIYKFIWFNPETTLHCIRFPESSPLPEQWVEKHRLYHLTHHEESKSG